MREMKTCIRAHTCTWRLTAVLLYKSQEVEATPRALTDGRVKKTRYTPTHRELFGSKEEWKTNSYYGVDEPYKKDAE